eukprot:6455734-Amphidinium_carterae.1
MGGQALKLARSKGTWNAVDGPVAALVKTALRLQVRQVDLMQVSASWLQAWVLEQHRLWLATSVGEPEADWDLLAQLVGEYKHPLEKYHAVSIIGGFQWTQSALHRHGGALHPYCALWERGHTGCDEHALGGHSWPEGVEWSIASAAGKEGDL